MDPSDRLDALVEKARALFEAKYGPSKGCFAAFSPAKVVSGLAHNFPGRRSWPFA